MTRLNPAFTSLKTLSITHQSAKETLLSTPETLPTSEPATPQIGYTVAESDFPTFSFQLYQRIFVGVVVGAGKVTTAATISYRMKKNGSSVYNSTLSVSANYYYTIMAFFLDVKAGDVLELALWSSQSDSSWDYKAFQVQVTRIIPFNKPRLLMPCNFKAMISQPALSLGNPSFSLQNLLTQHLDQTLFSISAAKDIEVIYAKDTYGIFRINYGDNSYSNSAATRTSSSYRPYYYRNVIPTSIVMRALRTEGQP